MNKNLSDILKNTIAEEEKFVQKKSLTLEEKVAMVDYLKNSTPIANEKNTAPISIQDKTVAKTFTFKAADINLIDILIDKFLSMREKVNKSEILKLGLYVLSTLSEDELRQALSNIERLTPGRR